MTRRPYALDAAADALLEALHAQADVGPEDDAGERRVDGAVDVTEAAARVLAAAGVAPTDEKRRREAWRVDPVRESRVRTGLLRRTGIDVAVPIDPEDWMGPRRTVDIAALDRESLAAYLTHAVHVGHSIDVVGRILDHGEGLSEVYGG